MLADFGALSTKGVQGLIPYQPGKAIKQLEKELGISSIIKLASNENPKGCGPRALEAARHALQDLSRYPDSHGDELKAHLATHLDIDVSQLVVGNGSNEVLELVAKSFLTNGDEALFSEHAFAVYKIATQCTGAKGIEVPAREWGHDLSAFLNAITDNTKLIFLANPNNPTGTHIGFEALTAFMDKVPGHVVVIIDEAYVEYANAADYQSALSLVSKHSNLIVTRTFSKVYGLAALRIGYGVAGASVAEILNKVRPPFSVNTVGLAAAIAALADQDFVDECVTENAEQMKLIENGLNTLGCPTIPSLGNFISFDLGFEAKPIFDALLKKGVIVRPVANYGMPNHLRVTIGSPEENQRFLTALASVLEENSA